MSKPTKLNNFLGGKMGEWVKLSDLVDAAVLKDAEKIIGKRIIEVIPPNKIVVEGNYIIVAETFLDAVVLKVKKIDEKT